MDRYRRAPAEVAVDRLKRSCKPDLAWVQGGCPIKRRWPVTRTTKRLRAIDVYSGVGGWSLGLRLAGIDVVASYDRWGAANETNFKNNSHQAQTVDVRRLALEEIPSDIDLVVGSPPCVEFSFSNRGGSGDISDGLQDIVRFLSIVDHLRPRLWVMENVPRVAQILELELTPGGALAQFTHLNCTAHIVICRNTGFLSVGNGALPVILTYNYFSRIAKN